MSLTLVVACFWEQGTTTHRNHKTVFNHQDSSLYIVYGMEYIRSEIECKPDLDVSGVFGDSDDKVGP